MIVLIIINLLVTLFVIGIVFYKIHIVMKVQQELKEETKALSLKADNDIFLTEFNLEVLTDKINDGLLHKIEFDRSKRRFVIAALPSVIEKNILNVKKK